MQPHPGYLNRPEVFPENLFFWDAFWELSSERSIGQGVGPIPYRALVAYAELAKLTGDAFEMFRLVIRDVDAVYLARRNAPSSKTFLRDEVSVTDVSGVKSLLGRLAIVAETEST